jgi:hypothetical protein
MLAIYLVGLGFGGTLLVASLFFGGGHHGGDAHGGADQHGSDNHGASSIGWMPIASLRFWTFLLGFGGLTGTLLTYATSLSAPIVGVLAGAIGWACGVAVVAVMRKAERGVDSELSDRDMRGETANVLVTIAPGKIGKVRVQVKGRVVDLAASCEDEVTFAPGEKVMIVGEMDGGRVQVTAP